MPTDTDTESTVQCDECEATVRSGDALSRDNDDLAPWLCPECYWHCDNCGDRIGPDDAFSRFGNDEPPWVCVNCNDDSPLHPYAYTPAELIFHGTDGRIAGTPYLGLELEIEATDAENREAIVAATEGSSDLFYCKSDASLDTCGVEVVTHPMTIAYAQEIDWDDLCATLRQHGRSWDTGSCGIHVHLSRDSMARSHLWRLGKLLNGNRPEFVALAGRCSGEWAAYEDHWAAQGGKVVAGKADAINRYRALNLRNDGTVEIRIFRGTLNPVLKQARE